MNTYYVYFKGERLVIRANTSFAATNEAARQLKARRLLHPMASAKRLSATLVCVDTDKTEVCV